MRAPLRALALTATAGAGAIAYASIVERNWFALRQFEVPVLPAGATSLRILHLSDVHLTPGRHRLMSWIRSLDTLDPDLVVNTGDSIAHEDSVQPFLAALGPLLERPGIFVYGSNDLYSPVPKNPLRYLYDTNELANRRHNPHLPWADLREGLADAGWPDGRAPRHLVGTAGTVTTLAATHLDLYPYDLARINNLRMSRAEFTALRDRLLAMTHDERQAVRTIEPGRADLIVAGLAIIDAILARWSYPELIVVDAGLLEGAWLETSS